MKTVQERAKVAMSHLTRLGLESEEGTGMRAVVVAEGAPEWVREMCMIVHSGNLPSDWIYEFIQDSLTALAEADEPDEVYLDLDSLYPYTRDRLNWLASNLDRHTLCDEAVEDAGHRPSELMTWVAIGMQGEMNAVLDRVRDFLINMTDEGED